MEKIQEQQQQQEGAMKSRFKRICVFCGSSPGKNPSYQLAAIQLGKQLVVLLFLT
jgi:predicted Rossmann-fold nucleotide-binding protein